MKDVKLSFPNKDDKTVFIVSVKVDDGLYKGKWYRFKFKIDEEWPYKSPYIRILDKIWHPNIGLIISEDNPENGIPSAYHNDIGYLATTTLHMIIESFKYILVNPNPNNAQNIEAAEELKRNPEKFEANVKRYLDEMPDEQ